MTLLLLELAVGICPFARCKGQSSVTVDILPAFQVLWVHCMIGSVTQHSDWNVGGKNPKAAQGT